MNRDEKAAVIDQVAEEIGGSEAVFAVDYRGITVAQIKELRTKLADSQTTLQVTKNSLAELAADKAGATELKSLLAGPTALAFVKGDAAAAAKVLSDTARVLRGPLASKGGYMNGATLTPEQVNAIAQLPTREVLYAQLVGTVAAPITGVVRGLHALIQGLAIQLGAIQDQGLVGQGAPAAAAPAEADAEATPDADAAAPAAEVDTPVAGDAPADEAASPQDASDDATSTDA
ncbi:MAG TPA: 50S ribosomal protein L10 [Solirubrobacteraceae bacterium]|nr:50S ribosomal protein L10 [Solirubrobacteraceae bacterium]